jgi:hypothetical protein
MQSIPLSFGNWPELVLSGIPEYKRALGAVLFNNRLQDSCIYPNFRKWGVRGVQTPCLCVHASSRVFGGCGGMYSPRW